MAANYDPSVENLPKTLRRQCGHAYDVKKIRNSEGQALFAAKASNGENFIRHIVIMTHSPSLTAFGLTENSLASNLEIHIAGAVAGITESELRW